VAEESGVDASNQGAMTMADIVNFIPTIEEIGSTEPTRKIKSKSWVSLDERTKASVCAEVFRIVRRLSEISIGADEFLSHSVTGKPLTEEWLAVYLDKAIEFRVLDNNGPNHYYDGSRYRVVPVPDWLSHAMLEPGLAKRRVLRQLNEPAFKPTPE
jgi:hypothetical protein